MVQRGSTESKKFENGLKYEAERNMENEASNRPVMKKLEENPKTVGILSESKELEKSIGIEFKQEADFESRNQKKDGGNHRPSSEGRSAENENVATKIIASSITEANSLIYLSEDDIYSTYEGSANYELSPNSNETNYIAISQERNAMSEGSADMQLNMHLALENDKEYGSGEEDHVKQQIVESTEKEYFTAIENEFEEQIDEAFLEVNNKVPRLLQTSVPSNNKLSNDVTTSDNKKEFTVETDITSDQFLIDFTN